MSTRKLIKLDFKRNEARGKVNKKYVFLIIVLILILPVGIFAIKKMNSQDENNIQIKEVGSDIRLTVSIISDCIKEGYSGDYGAVYKSVRNKKEILGQSKETLRSEILEYFTKAYANEDFAKEKDIMPSSMEIENYFKEQVKATEGSDNFNEDLKQSLKEHNLSTEVFLGKGEYYNQRQDCISQNIFKYIEDLQGESADRDKILSEIDKIEEEYKKTHECKEKLEKIDSIITEIYGKLYD